MKTVPVTLLEKLEALEPPETTLDVMPANIPSGTGASAEEIIAVGHAPVSDGGQEVCTQVNRAHLESPATLCTGDAVMKQDNPSHLWTQPPAPRGSLLLDPDGHIVERYCSTCHTSGPVRDWGDYTKCLCGHILAWKCTGTLAQWISHLEDNVSWYDATLARRVRKHQDCPTAQDMDVLRQLQVKYPQETERYFPWLTAELVLIRGRELLRGVEVEI